MKFLGLGISLLFASLVGVSAQVTVEVTQERNDFLVGESMPVAVRITNRSGQTLRLGMDPDWLTFAIESSDGVVVPKLGEVPVQGEFDLESSQVAIKRVDLTPYFSVSRHGRYGIVALVKIKNWSELIESRPKYFDLVEGIKLWEQEVGVPQGSGTSNSIPEIRKYLLQEVNTAKSQLRLYVSVVDAYGKPYRVVSAGRGVSFSRPEPQIDRLSQMHLLFQDGASSFSYTVFDLNGEVVLHQMFNYITTRPRLRMDDVGRIVVQGGNRVVSASDVPPPTPEELEAALHPPELPATNATNSAKGDKRSKK